MTLDPFKEATNALQIAASPRFITAAALCWTFGTLLATSHVAAQAAFTEQYPPEEPTQTSVTSEPDEEAGPVKP